MNRFFFTLELVVLGTLAANAQGTIAFGNSALTRVLVRDPATGVIRGNHPTASDGLTFAVLFGLAGTTAPDALTQVHQPAPVATIGTTAGVMINAPSVFALLGTEGGQVVSLQIRAWDFETGGQRLDGQTAVAQVTLGPTAGPGAVIWQTATGTRTGSPRWLSASPSPPPSRWRCSGSEACCCSAVAKHTSNVVV